MYAWPENAAEVEARWRALRQAILPLIPAAPSHLTPAEGALEDIWLSPQLLFAQTCSYPLANALAGRVRYVATPSCDAEGCETAGHYRSVVVARAEGMRQADMPVPRHPGHDLPDLPDLPKAAVFAFNTPDSMSGLHGLQADLALDGRRLPERRLETGGHRASIIAVARGRADLAAIDCVSWAMARRHEPASRGLRVIGWTSERPGLPFITALATNDDHFEILRQAVMAQFSALVLDQPYRL
jgi:ABC-type phosphate/phosphonate transport system substrate-binding protein